MAALSWDGCNGLAFRAIAVGSGLIDRHRSKSEVGGRDATVVALGVRESLVAPELSAPRESSSRTGIREIPTLSGRGRARTVV
jgi:hypothetical protein